MSTPTKAEKMLGVHKAAKTATMSVQMKGFLQLREPGMLSSWKKRYGVIKDGFFIWYTSPPSSSSTSTCSFDRKPKGIMPLNGAIVRSVDENKTGTLIELIQPDIPKANLILKLYSALDASEWARLLEKGRSATWEKSQLGAAILEKMKAEGTKLEEEKNAAVLELEKRVEKLNKATEAKLKMMEKQGKQLEKLEKKVKEQEKAVDEKEKEKQLLEQEIADEEKEIMDSISQTKEMEKKLSMANLALRRLELALKQYFDQKGGPQRQISVKETFETALRESVSPRLARAKSANSIQVESIEAEVDDGSERPRGFSFLSVNSETDPFPENSKRSKNKNERNRISPSQNIRRKRNLPNLPPPVPKPSRDKVKRSVQYLRRFFDDVADKHKKWMAFYDNENIRKRAEDPDDSLEDLEAEFNV